MGTRYLKSVAGGRATIPPHDHGSHYDVHGYFGTSCAGKVDPSDPFAMLRHQHVAAYRWGPQLAVAVPQAAAPLRATCLAMLNVHAFALPVVKMNR